MHNDTYILGRSQGPWSGGTVVTVVKDTGDSCLVRLRSPVTIDGISNHWEFWYPKNQLVKRRVYGL